MSHNASKKPLITLRKPPEMTQAEREVATQAFIRDGVAPGARGLELVERPSVEVVSTEQGMQASIVCRQDGRQRRRMTIYLPPELAQRLKLHSVTTGEDMSDVVARALEAHLGAGG
jgi:hypothetical protein